MRVIMPDSVLSSPTDDHNEKPTYECPLPSCLSTETQSKLPCHLLQIVSDCAKKTKNKQQQPGVSTMSQTTQKRNGDDLTKEAHSG